MFGMSEESISNMMISNQKREQLRSIEILNYQKKQEEIRQSKEKECKLKFFKKGIDSIELMEINKSEVKLSPEVIKNLFPFKDQEEIDNHWKSFSNSREK